MNSTIIKSYYCINNFKNAIRQYHRISTSIIRLQNYKRQSRINIEKIRELNTAAATTTPKAPEFPPGNPNEKAKLEHLLFIKENFTINVSNFNLHQKLG
jgi:hypothetical protein